MKELEEFFKNVKRIADALEANQNKLSETEGANQNMRNPVVMDSKANTSDIPTIPVPLGQIPVSNTVQTYTRDQIAVAMGRSMDDPAKMQLLSSVLAEFGATSLMDVPEDQYSNLVLRLKTIGVEV